MSAAVVITSYAVTKHLQGKNEVDSILRSDVGLKRIQTSTDFEGHPFYATYLKHDSNEYAGLFGKNLRSRAKHEAAKDLTHSKAFIKQQGNMPIYQLTIHNKDNLKVPSNSHAGEITADLLKDDDFKAGVSKSIADAKGQMHRSGQQQLFNSAERLLKKDPSTLTNKEKKTVYKALNLTLTFHSDNDIKVQNKFYSALKSKGYGALVDVNDNEFSSYHARRPMIVFDTSGLKVTAIRKLSEGEINRKNAVYNTERILKEIGDQTLGTAYTTAKSGASAAGRGLKHGVERLKQSPYPTQMTYPDQIKGSDALRKASKEAEDYTLELLRKNASKLV